MIDRHWLLSLTSSSQCAILNRPLLTTSIQACSCPVNDILAEADILASFRDNQTTVVA